MTRARSIALAASAAVVPAAMAATSGSLTALSMNVAGLPEFLQNNEVPGDKTTNTATIGTKFAEYGYDIINVQEDFNYHATLYEYDNHTYRTATSGGVPFGSGLNTLSNFDWIDFERVKWDECSNASGADCLTPKGFTFMRVKVDESVWIDVYNLHADAGIEDADQSARRSNIQQVASHIATSSAGNAVLVFGDTNSRYTRAADNIAILSSSPANLIDAWVVLEHGGTPPSVESLCANPSTNNSCETVDKLFYRGSPLVSLAAAAFRFDSSNFLQPNGSILSDHNPIRVALDWAVAPNLRQSDLFGGPHGSWFSDAAALPPSSSPSGTGATLTLRGAERLDGVALNLTDGSRFAHGGGGGAAQTLALAADEVVDSVRLCQGQYNDQTRVFYMRAGTSAGRGVEAGTATADCVTYDAPSGGFGAVGFVGRDGDEVDRLGVIWGRSA